MRFIVMHTTDARWEAGAIPGPDLIARVGKLMGELSRAGILLGGEGLRASSQGVRLRFSAGKRQVIKGPFTGENELPAGFWIVQVPGIEDATDWASRLAAAVGDGELDVRPVTEPWDIGMIAPPEKLPLRRYMLLRKATAASEAGIRRSPKQRAALGRLVEEMTRAGVLLTAAELQPSAKGKRFRFGGARTTVIDGPFTETKELLAGYVMFEAPTLDQAADWASRYGQAVDSPQVDLRQVEEPQ
jgi:hypothetical protein